MKKKPPPGATLIARLKEQRLAREQELARRQAEANGNGTPAESTAAHTDAQESSFAADSAPAPPPPPPAANVALAPQRETQEAVNVEIVAPDAIPDIAVHSRRAQAPASTEVAQTASPQQAMMSAAQGAGDLLHRQIDINDLRPTTDDYFALTDEIRLAGRFAAVGLIAQGLRLQRLKEQAIYKEHYQTFEEYCRKEHQMSATYAYRLIRMSEMAERIAHSELPALEHTDAMPDPFEVMISLGHRHLMALLPLEADAAQELLLKGIPVQQEESGAEERVPLTKATEKQIKAALKAIMPPTAPAKVVTRVVDKRALVDEKQLIPALSKLVEMLEDWGAWLGGEAPPELEAARIGRGQLLTRLAKRFRTASANIADALDGESER